MTITGATGPTLTVGVSSFVVNSGNVGIGTSTPGGMLEIRAPAVDGRVLLRLGDSGSNTSTLDIWRDASSGNFKVQTNQSGTQAIDFIPTGGSIGIATSNPGSTLDVNGSETVRSQATFTSTVTVQGTAFSVGGSDIYVSGNTTGIATTSPGSTLDVNGITTIRGAETVVGSATISGAALIVGTATIVGSATIQGSETILSTLTVQGAGFRVGTPTSGFYNSGNTTGVNTITPGTALDVNGGLTVRGQLTTTSSATINDNASVSGTFGVGTVTPGSALDTIGTITGSSISARGSITGQTAIISGPGATNGLALTVNSRQPDVLTPQSTTLNTNAGVLIAADSNATSPSIQFTDNSNAATSRNWLIADFGNIAGDLEFFVSASSFSAPGTSVMLLDRSANTHFNTTGGTELYRCAGGTDAGWILYGNTGAAQTLCTGGGGSLTALPIYAP